MNEEIKILVMDEDYNSADDLVSAKKDIFLLSLVYDN